MRTILRNALLGTVLLGAAIAVPMRAGHTEKQPMKQAILLVAFGTSKPEARVAFENIDRLARSRFPQKEIRWAYTSSMIRRKLAKQGEFLDSPLVALAKLQEEKYTHVAVQSLHIAAGAEYHDLAKTVASFRTGPNAFQDIALGKPLIVRRSDLDSVVKALLDSLPARDPGDAVVMMGHGNSTGRNDMLFLAADAAFREADPAAMLATVEGQPNLTDVTDRLEQVKAKRALLVPFMSVAGDHARNDLAGPEEDSWRSVISALGIECIPVLKGMGEYDVVVTVWLDHLQSALDSLTPEHTTE